MSSKQPGLGSRFHRVLAAHAFSQLGFGLHLAAFPLLASALTSDPRVIAALALTTSAPSLLLALPVGVLVDRTHRGRLMVAGDTACALVLAVVGVLVAADRIELWMVFTAAAAIGIAELLFGTSLFALVPSLVRDVDLTSANSRLSIAGEAGSGMLGPPIGGVTYAAAPFLAFVSAATASAVSALTVGSFAWTTDTMASERRADRRGDRPHASSVDRRCDQPAAIESWRESLVAGFRFVARHRPTRTLVVLSAAAGLFGWTPEATLVLFLRDELGVDPAGFGLLLGITTVGAVLGGLVAGRVATRLGTFRLLVLTYTGYGVLLIPVGLADAEWLIAVLFFLQGLPLIAYDAAIRSLQQRVAPDELLGRVSAVNRVVHGAVVPLSLAAGGFLASWVGFRVVWVIAGLGFCAALLVNLPTVRSLHDAAASR